MRNSTFTFVEIQEATVIFDIYKQIKFVSSELSFSLIFLTSVAELSLLSVKTELGLS